MKYRYIKNSLLFIGLLLMSLSITAQEFGAIKGIVADSETNNPLSFAEIMVEETGQGTVALEDGSFEIKDVKAGAYTIKVHLLGYSNQTLQDVKVEAGKKVMLEFVMVVENIGLGEVTVSATKIKTTIDKIGSPVYIIDRKEIELTEGRNIDEVLNRIPGVFTEDRYHNESAVVSFRGVGLHTHVTRGILVLVDGVSLTEAMGRTDFESIDMENAERVEVLKGPVSALYGPNGITGVINIIEKSPEDGINGGVKASYGSYNTMNFSGNINGGKNGFKYLVKGKYYNSDGYQNRSNYESARGGLKLSQQFKNAGKLQFTDDYISTVDELPGTLDSAQFYNLSTESSNLFAGYDKDYFRSDLVYTQSWGDHMDFYANAFYRDKNSSGFYSDSRLSVDDIKTLGGEARAKFSQKIFNKKNSIIFGVNYLSEGGTNLQNLRDELTGELGRMVSNGQSTYDMVGVYAEDEFLLIDQLAITFGIRFDMVNYDWKDELYEGEDNTSNTTSISSFSPKFGIAYNPTNNITVFGNVARGFNPPQISQLFVGSSYSGLANPDLKPEYLTNYELGIRGDIKQKLIYQLSLFRMDFVDQIASEIDPAIDPRVPINQNIGETRHTGLETALEYRFTNRFNVYVNYSYLNAKFVSDDEYNDKILRKTPHNIANAGLRYSFKFGLTAALDYKFIDKYFMDNENVNEYEGYSMVNLKFLYRKEAFTASLALNNLLNSNYATWAYASESYNPQTHQTTWEQMYIPGWPMNFNLSIGYTFGFNKK
ncbi:MAG: TonB-dependent receptor [Bacteroidales bacterium]|nr:TonB-dependent receptor [Bacteroidales bacterium]